MGVAQPILVAVFVFLYAEPQGVVASTEAARAAGVEHVVVLSSLSVSLGHAERNPIAARHLVVERAVEQAGIPWTFLRPGDLAANARL